MKILILGSGGREHALAWKLAQSPNCNKLFIAPGNAGTSQVGENIPHMDPMDFDAVAESVLSLQIGMVVIGPEAPLVEGLADFLRDQIGDDLIIVGPSKTAAILEGSKDYSKEFMRNYGIPTADYASFSADETEKAISYLHTLSPPYVLKADGLAAGKGVIICDEKERAIEELRQMLSGKFGKASSKVVIEEYLDGTEFSVFILTDGKGQYLLLPEAKDYKRIGEGDTGPNTGGMGAVSPVDFVDDKLMNKVIGSIIQPTLDGLLDRGIEYQGFIFFGLINHQGTPKVIEYNCRLGDPETEVILPRIQSDLVVLFEAMHEEKLAGQQIVIRPEAASTVMLVSKGYPGPYRKGLPIQVPEDGKALFFHSGTLPTQAGTVTNGGRVIACTALGQQLREALDASYAMAKQIAFEGKTYRQDIGRDLLS